MELSSRFADALAYAAQLHAAQFRKGTKIPYVAHLLSVTALVLESGGNENQAIAAVLHDAVEDQGGAATAAAIRERFGDEVTELVLACTDTDESPKPPWQARKQHYLDHLSHSPPAAFIICGADKLHNITSILHDYEQLGTALWSRFGGGREGTLWYFRELVKLLDDRMPRAMHTRLAGTMARLEELVQQREGR